MRSRSRTWLRVSSGWSSSVRLTSARQDTCRRDGGGRLAARGGGNARDGAGVGGARLARALGGLGRSGGGSAWWTAAVAAACATLGFGLGLGLGVGLGLEWGLG